MNFVISELQKSLKYNQRQLEENERKIQHNLESNTTLESANLRHKQAIEEITQMLDELEKRQTHHA